MNLSNSPMTPKAFACMLSSAKEEIRALAENLFCQRIASLEEEIRELKREIVKLKNHTGALEEIE